MLSVLLGKRSFSSKCESYIRNIRTRSNGARGKLIAIQKFVKQDIADLLTKGQEITAFGKAERQITEMHFISCYNYVDRFCGIILKLLPIMKEKGKCPEGCKEAVASLMFAAAWSSHLPELRDLRNLFQERYGNSLESFVNKELVEHVNPKPPSMKTKLELLKDIASKLSVNWDSNAFEQRLINDASASEDEPANRVIIHSAKENIKNGSEATHKMKGKEALKKEHQEQRQRSDRPFHGQELDHNKHKPPLGPKSIHKTKERAEPVLCRQKMINDASAREDNSAKENEYIVAKRGSEATHQMKGKEALKKEHQERGGAKDFVQRQRSDRPFHGQEKKQIKEDKPATRVIIHSAKENIKNGSEATHQTKRKEALKKEHQERAGAEDFVQSQRSDRPFHGQELDHNKHKPPIAPKSIQKTKERAEPVLCRQKISFRQGIKVAPVIEHQKTTKVQTSDVKPNESNHKSSHLESTGKGDDRSRTDPTSKRRSSSIRSDAENVEEVGVVRRVPTSRRRNGTKKGMRMLSADDEGYRGDDELSP